VELSSHSEGYKNVLMRLKNGLKYWIPYQANIDTGEENELTINLN
jgi:hypothetical protein